PHLLSLSSKRPLSFSTHLSPPPDVCLSYLPSLRAFLGELGKVDRLLWVFLPVLLSTCLNKEGVCRRLPLWFVGYTEIGVKNAERWNKGPEVVQSRNEKQRYCVNHVGPYYNGAVTKSVKPSVRINSEDPSGGSHQSVLVCSAYDFYPKHIRVSWRRDGQEVKSDVTSTEEMADGDWYYQIHSHLEYTPRSGEKISCVVEHASLKEPLITNWDPSMPEAERNKLAIGASGLILGLVLSLAGFIYYKRKARGRILVPTN
uniref:H-2 class II histocompatibility antigen, E-S beta chain-like n=1 Tax=Echeneis naucrates TaxID=173247 RepID=A0A665TN75_ECHNA